MTFTPLHSCVSVMLDVREMVQNAIDNDDLGPDEYEAIIDLIDSAFAVGEVKVVMAEIQANADDAEEEIT